MGCFGYDPRQAAPTPSSGSPLNPAQHEFINGLAIASDLESVKAVSEQYRLHRGALGADAADPDYQQGLRTALHRFVRSLAADDTFAQWADTYFGFRAGRFRDPRQRPDFIYFPALDPVPWFERSELPELQLSRTDLDEAVAELGAFLKGRRAFEPYVGAEAKRDPRWRDLAGNEAWSSIHLLKGGRKTAVLDALPVTARLLQLLPLADCPPHAPECFLSWLRPGTVLPPHHGVSNIKLTTHLPVLLPKSGCSITVGGETRAWRHGELLVFDDSFLHSARNLSDEDRVVLIFDIWQPALPPLHRQALAGAIAAMDVVNQVAWTTPGE